MDLSVKLPGGVVMEHPLMNGGGLIKTVEDVREATRSALAAIEIGSITVEPRTGSLGNVYYAEAGFSLNSLGIPNPGLPYYRDRGMLKEMIQIIHDAGKVAVVNVAGFDVNEFFILTEIALDAGADFVNENFGCPNIVDGSVQKPVISYDLACFDIVSDFAAAHFPYEKIWVKVSPFSNPADRKRFGERLSTFGVSGIVSTNTLPNGFAFDKDGKPVITPNNGYAGLAGPALKPIALAHVRQYAELRPDLIRIGAGGVTSGRDVLDYLRAGATIVQAVTAFLDPDGRHRLDRASAILDEYVQLMEQQPA